MSTSPANNFNFGYPTPGQQSPTGQNVMNSIFFLSDDAWDEVRQHETFDYIVIGTGPCALGFITQALENNPFAKILVLERGPFFLPEHFQNLPMLYAEIVGGLIETFPWTLSSKTHQAEYIKYQNGMVPFFGGRSTLWSAWCPRPNAQELADWPEPVVAAANQYFDKAEKLLHVIPVSKIDKGRKDTPPKYRPIYGVLQEQLTQQFEDHLDRVPSATRVMPAPIAVNAPEFLDVDFAKFSTPGAFLNLIEHQSRLAQQNKGAPLKIVTECTVTQILQQRGVATAIETTRGTVNVGNSQIILAMGTLPPTTLVLNSFPQVKNAGKRFSAHFISSIIARVPRAAFPFSAELAELELAAIYMAGLDKESGGQYHIQLTALFDEHPESFAPSAARHMPDMVATASIEQLNTSKDHVVLVCATLGELNVDNKKNWLRRNDGTDKTTNVTLQAVESKADRLVWDTMDAGTFAALEDVVSPDGRASVEYWHVDDAGNGSWLAQRPSASQIRVPGLVHEGSTLWIGADKEAVVGLDYRLKGVDNVYVTGGSLWPRAGSWNPTLTMVALAQHLADRLTGCA